MSSKLSKLKVGSGYEYKIMISKAEFEILSAFYDELYEKSSLILAEHDPCRIDNGKCLRGEPCCDGCNHLSKDKGCTAKSLACRVWLCNEARKRFPKCAAALDELSKIASINRFLGYRTPKEKAFSDYMVIDE